MRMVSIIDGIAIVSGPDGAKSLDDPTDAPTRSLLVQQLVMFMYTSSLSNFQVLLVLHRAPSEEVSGNRGSRPGVTGGGFLSLGEQGVSDDGTSRHNNEVIAVLVLGEELNCAARIAIENAAWQSGLELCTAEHKHAESVLREAYQQSLVLFERARDAIFVFEAETGNILNVNKAAERLAQQPKHKLIGSPYDRIFGVDDTGENHDFAGILQVNGGLTEREAVILTERERIPVEMNGNVVELPDGKHVVQAIARDIRQRKQAEAELRRLNRALTALSKCNDALVHATDEATLLGDICEILVQVGGYRMAWVGYAGDDEDKTVRVTAKSGLDDGYTAQTNVTWADIPHGQGPTGTAIRTGECCVVTNIGSDPRFSPWCNHALRRGYNSCIALPLQGQSSILGAITIYASEVNVFDSQEVGLLQELAGNLAYGVETRKLHDQLAQAQKMEAIGRLAGGVAHDFNNLLMIISSYTEMLQEQLPAAHSWRKNTAQVLAAANRAASLTQQLLAFSRKQVLAPQLIDLNTVIESTLKMIRRLIGEDVDVHFAPTPDLGMARVDPTQITQVLLNLCINARDAMPRGGKLTIETSNVLRGGDLLVGRVWFAPGRYVMLAVSDNGVGMSPEVQKHIFEPFFTTKPQGKGTGLGLSTVYGSVKQSGGYITVYSEPNRGTTFKVYLPVVNEAVVPARRPAEAARSNGNGETILVVEDEPGLRQAICQYLSEHGYHVLEAASGPHALQFLDQKIDLLLTDIIMPNMSGRELARQLEGRMSHLRTVYMSGYADDAVIHHGVLEPGLLYIQKPFTLDALVKRLREAFNSGRDHL